jgi:hypothetical protein
MAIMQLHGDGPIRIRGSRKGGQVARRGASHAGLAASASSSLLSAWSTRGFMFMLMALAGWSMRDSVSFSSATPRVLLTDPQQDQQAALRGVTHDTVLPYYTPTLYAKDKYQKEDFPWPMIHILVSPFMQKQPNLTALGHARVGLFDAFCYPTVTHQTSQQFLWIMKTDPNLDPGILKKMVEFLKPFPNYYLIGSNADDLYLHWRNGSLLKDLAGLRANISFPTRVYTGNQTLLEMAMALATELPVLETRLDADDGLNVQFMETIQKMATKEVFSPPLVKWKHWCVDRVVEWHSTISNNKMDMSPSMSYGKVKGPERPHFCITPGLTTAYAVGTLVKEVAIHGHHEIRHRIQNEPLKPGQECGLSNTSECMDTLVGLEPFESLRARTPTSAGMRFISLEPEANAEDDAAVEAMWANLNTYFHIQRDKVQVAQAYFKEHVVEIAKDNLVGQCLGFSCKNSSKTQLEKIIATYSAA